MTLSQKRGQIKAQLTRMAKFLSEKPNASLEELEVRLYKLTNLIEKFEEVQDEIDAEENSDPEEELANREEFEDTYFKTEAEFRKAIAKIKEQNLMPTTVVNAPNTEDLNNLPKITLPTFDGELTSLKNAAAELLESVPISAENYDIAWNTLISRYNNKKRIVNFHLDCLFNQQALKVEGLKELSNLLDTTNKHVRALKALGVPTEHWDDILVHLVTTRLDFRTRKAWDLSLKDNDLPTYAELEEFLNRQCFALSNNSLKRDIEKPTKNYKQASHITTNNSYKSFSCSMCNESHRLYKCPKFLKMKNKEKLEFVKGNEMCLKCFSKKHSFYDCTFYDCKKCKGKHNVLVCMDLNGKDVRENSLTTNSNSDSSTNQVLLATALIRVEDRLGNYHMCRALLDSGSQSNFITKNLATRLGLTLKKSNTKVSGIMGTDAKSGFCTTCQISSAITNYKDDFECLVLKKITSNLPSSSIDTKDWDFISSFTLADHSFSKTGAIDLLIGAEKYDEIIENETFRFSKAYPTLRRTKFGWIVSGKFVGTNYTRPDVCSLVSTNILSKQLRLFWEIEEIQNEQPEECYCETFFKKNFKRLTNGKYEIPLPFEVKKSHLKLGESKRRAEILLKRMEYKRKNDKNFDSMYKEFMKEYLELGHMELVPAEKLEMPENKCYYLPHHAVLKESSTTTKLRVVFDGSAKTTSGQSLNDLLALGPIIQNDLFSVLCRFRFHQVALIADVEKMYRQVLISEEDREFQRILWRFSESEQLKTYRLTTVTYGLKPSSFLAIRALQQCARDNAEKYPKASELVLHDFYVDDLISGADNIENAIKLKGDLIELTKSGGFPLRKWHSNLMEVIDEKEFPPNESKHKFTDFRNETTNTLGMVWHSKEDEFKFTRTLCSNACTKRIVVSELAKIFDPLGLLAPVVILGKIFIQTLWIKKIGWDEKFSNELEMEWIKIYNCMKDIKQISICRLISSRSHLQSYEIHAFCDASKQAYAAAVYVVSSDADGIKTAKLLCCKTKVAPLKTVTIPRLELCAATLLSKLVLKLNGIIKVKINKFFFWTDSQVVLSWITSPPKEHPKFIENRISLIQDNLKELDHKWLYVPTKENPVDIATRGCTAGKLSELSLWWSGPKFLLENQTKWPVIKTVSIKEKETIALNVINREETENYYNVIERYSSFSKMLFHFANLFRFARVCKGGNETKFISAADLKKSHSYLLKLHQKRYFLQEIQSLEKFHNLPKSSSILSLNPFLDENGLLRVGGRISKSALEYDKCHPYLISKQGNLPIAIIDYEHKKNCHAQLQLLKSILSSKYWIIRGTSLIKQRIRTCITCAKNHAKITHQLMGDLPASRLTPTRPFNNCGVDYAGPVNIRIIKGRGKRLTKAYVALFVCFTTRAVHIELVTDLTVDSFIGALKRFIYRRGKPSNIYSDNGRNFVGTKSTFEDFRKLIQSLEYKNQVAKFTAEEFISWHFIPAYAPHMGGLWEAGIKSMKTHLKAVLKEKCLSYEELNTVLIEIEGCLNSRPLTELSTDPSDLEPLTPGHFLIGSSLKAIPEPEILNEHVNLLKRWRLVQQIGQRFWARWVSEFLVKLQTRTKWRTKNINLSVGNLVLLKKIECPVMKWPMGRILEVHPGSDSVVRVVTVKTASGTFKRNINQVLKLPLDIENASQSGEYV